MWRFIILSFAFMGAAFYELSGGADYAPRPDSLQARALLDGHRPTARPGSTAPAAVNAAAGTASQDALAATERVAAADVTAPAGTATDGAGVVLASAAGAVVSPPMPAPDSAPRADTLSDEARAAVARASLANLPSQRNARVLNAPSASGARDIRRVMGNGVNMRGGPGTAFDPVARLARDTEVAVLQAPGHGWLKLEVVETGRVGWMAGWLVTPRAN